MQCSGNYSNSTINYSKRSNDLSLNLVPNLPLIKKEESDIEMGNSEPSKQKLSLKTTIKSEGIDKESDQSNMEMLQQQQQQQQHQQQSQQQPPHPGLYPNFYPRQMMSAPSREEDLQR
jgi:hypothetical protein